MQPSAVQNIIIEALGHHQSGRLNEAERLYKKVLSIDPRHADSFHLLGLIAHQVGKNDVGMELIRQAILYRNTVPLYHYNLGCVLKALDRINDAEAAFKQALVLKPEYADALLNLGNIYLDRDDFDNAKTSYERAVAIAPNLAEAHNNLGNALYRLGMLDEAQASYEKACAVAPNDVLALNNLGNIFRKKGDIDQALGLFQRALALSPDFAEAHFNIGLAYDLAGKPLEAFNAFRTSARLDPSRDVFRIHMASVLPALIFQGYDPRLIEDLENMCGCPHIRLDLCVQPILSTIRHHPDIKAFLETSFAEGEKLYHIKAAEAFGRSNLLLRLLTLTPLMDPAIEAAMTRVRRKLLIAVCEGAHDDDGLPYFAALASQCFVNDYAFAESDEENEAVDRLQDAVRNMLGNETDAPPLALAVLASYRPLHRLPWADMILTRSWPDVMHPLLRQQIIEPREENAIRPAIPCVTPVTDTVTQAVQQQYEENPYPRWVQTEIPSAATPVSEYFRDLFPDKAVDTSGLSETPSVLIAGCGTGRQSIAAGVKYADARVLAVDISLASIAYALRKTREASLTNIEYAQADILELGSLGQTFDIVECVGVLHHLDDPMKGWRVLCGLLKPKGLMKIGLYSEIARKPIVQARAMIAAKGYKPEPQDIRLCRQDIMAAHSDDPLRAILPSRDFYSLNNCRDLLFHVQEHRFTLPRIDAALNDLDLAFLGFEFMNETPPRNFKKHYPEESAQRNLSLWNLYEESNPSTFASMYQFWCQKKG